MKIKLVVVEGKTSKSQIAMTLPATIGRSRDASLTIAHPMISRRHCELFEQDGYAWVRDFGSTNGTIVEGKAVSESILAPDSLLRIGPLTFRVDYEPTVSAAPEMPGAAEAPPLGDVPFIGMPADDAPPVAQDSPGIFEGLPEALPAESDSPAPHVQIDVAGVQPPSEFPTINPVGGQADQPGLTAIGGSHPPVGPFPPQEPEQIPASPSPQVDSSLYDQPVAPPDFASYADTEPEPDRIEGVPVVDGVVDYSKYGGFSHPASPPSQAPGDEDLLDNLDVVEEEEEEEPEPTPPPPLPPNIQTGDE